MRVSIMLLVVFFALFFNVVNIQAAVAHDASVSSQSVKSDVMNAEEKCAATEAVLENLPDNFGDKYYKEDYVVDWRVTKNANDFCEYLRSFFEKEGNEGAEIHFPENCFSKQFIGEVKDILLIDKIIEMDFITSNGEKIVRFKL